MSGVRAAYAIAFACNNPLPPTPIFIFPISPVFVPINQPVNPSLNLLESTALVIGLVPSIVRHDVCPMRDRVRRRRRSWGRLGYVRERSRSRMRRGDGA